MNRGHCSKRTRPSSKSMEIMGRIKSATEEQGRLSNVSLERSEDEAAVTLLRNLALLSMVVASRQ